VVPPGPEQSLGQPPSVPGHTKAQPHTVSTPPGTPGHRAQWVIVGALVGLLVILLISGYFFDQALKLEQAQSLAESDAIARGVAAFIQAREENYLHSLVAYAGRFRFREAIKRKDRVEVLVHLRQFRELFPEMEATFLADPAGVVWARYPEVPEVYGRSFADQDWYRGVSREWRPYVSDVFLSAASGPPVVALAVPIRDPDAKIIGIIGSFQPVEVIRRWLLPIRVPGGDLYMVDRKGQFVFHATRRGAEQLADFARVPTVERLLRGEEGVLEQENPVEHEVRLSAYRQLPSVGWGLVVQRSRNLALQRVRLLILGSGTIGLLLTLALALLGVVALRSQRRVSAALADLERSTDQLRQSNVFLDSVLENIPNMVFVKDAKELRFISFNRAGEELLGYPREALISRNAYDVFSKSEADSFTSRDREVLDGRRLVDIPEEPIHTAHRGTRILHTRKIPILDDTGRPKYLLGISEDITEHREAKEALEEKTRALEAAQEELVRRERLAILGQLAGGLSHELRNPLGVIKNSVYFLRMVLPDDDRVRKHLGILDREVETGTRIITSLLNFARSTPPRRVPLDLNGLVRDELERVPAADGVTMRLDLAADAPAVMVDPEQIRLVFGNLLLNAIQAMPIGGTLTVRTAPTPTGTSLLVADTGVGIAQEHLAKIFEPLFTTKAKGIGLGLSLAKRLVESNDGSISVESAPGQGTRFELRFARP